MRLYKRKSSGIDIRHFHKDLDSQSIFEVCLWLWHRVEYNVIKCNVVCNSLKNFRFFFRVVLSSIHIFIVKSSVK